MKTVLTSHLILIIMFLPMLGKTQLVTISGNVTNSFNGMPLKNVSIFESSSNIGTITNEKGFFKLELLQGAMEVKVSSNGFTELTKKLILKNDTTIMVKLEPEFQERNKQKRQNILHADAKTSKSILGLRRNK